jgi:hypothetical protein
LDWGYPGDLSLDGKTFLFSEQGDGGGPQYSTYIRQMTGSAPVLLGSGIAFSLSPDGRSALVLNLAEPAHLALLPTGAGEAHPLPRGALTQFHWAAFFADGKRIAITGNEAGKGPRIWVQDVSGGDPVAISPEGVGFNECNPVSLDGAFVAGQSDAGISLFPVAGGDPRPVDACTEIDRPLRFSGDGRFLYVREDRGRGRLPIRLFRVDLASGTREPWKELNPPGATSLGGIGGITIAPDVGAHAYAYSEPIATLYEVSGLAR